MTQRVADLSETVASNSKTIDSLAALPKEVAEQSKLLQKLMEKLDKPPTTTNEVIDDDTDSMNGDPVTDFLESIQINSESNGEKNNTSCHKM